MTKQQQQQKLQRLKDHHERLIACTYTQAVSYHKKKLREEISQSGAPFQIFWGRANLVSRASDLLSVLPIGAPDLFQNLTRMDIRSYYSARRQKGIG